MSGESVTVRQVFPDEDVFGQVLDLRYRVLDGPKGIDRKTEAGRHDLHEAAIHVAAFAGGVVVSTVRLDQHGEEADRTLLVRRMATDPTYQRRGIGAQVLGLGEILARSQGADKIILHSRESAIPFYVSQGYEATGRVEYHDGDPNPEMVK